MKLSEKKLFLFDMDGTLYLDDVVFDGTHQLLDYISDAGARYLFVTNNSSKSVNDYVKKLSRLGIASDENSFVAHLLTDLYGKEGYLLLNESINFSVVGKLSAISVIQLVSMLLFFIVCAIIALKAVEKVRTILREVKDVKLKRPLKNLITQLFEAKYKTKIFLTNCVMLC